MAKTEKRKIGHLDCKHCGTEVPVRINDATGALSFPCHECSFPGYAKKSDEAYYRDMLAAVRPLPGDEPAPPPGDDEPAPKNPPPAAPAVKAKSTLFG